jgi:glucose-induced degradation protein 4
MPAHATNDSSDVNPNDIIPFTVACPQTVNLPNINDETPIVDRERPSSAMSPPASDNTAAGMSFAQEESMYPVDINRPMDVGDDQKENIEPFDEATGKGSHDITPTEPQPILLQLDNSDAIKAHSIQRPRSPVNEQLHTPSPTIPSSSPKPTAAISLPSCDHELNATSEAKPWDFTHTPLSTSIPSSLFRPFAKYTGTQQSDRQIYNVCVTLLTIDVAQSTMSGYLEICGLTPDHPELTTFFTGEIIGGPAQRYSFRTKDPSWGASNKTDMTHWARFPAWRPLSPHAKNDIEFVHPVDGSEWWQQEHIFMRWKEHFLVPDYKLRSIQGASFEGFYYICLNQVEGRISGIYFHSKSEK